MLNIKEFLEFFDLEYKKTGTGDYLIYDSEDDWFGEITCSTKSGIAKSVENQGRDDIYLYDPLEELYGAPSIYSPEELRNWLKQNPKPYSKLNNEPMSEKYYQLLMDITNALVDAESYMQSE